MRLVLIHGIGQGGRGETLEATWLDVLRRTVGGGADWPVPPAARIATGFYGDALAELTRAGRTSSAVAQGGDEAPDDLADFAAPAFAEMAFRIGVTEAELQDGGGFRAVAQGAGAHKRSIKAIARLIERVSPWRGALALRVLAEAHAYLKRPHVAERVDGLVRPALLGDGPMVVVAHSLGTIVAYKLLREMAQRGGLDCPLLMTLGSPLGIDAVRRSFPLPRNRPDGVARWLNAADPSDFVALRPTLDATTFGHGVENRVVENPGDDPHAIGGYLADEEVGRAIAEALAGRGG